MNPRNRTDSQTGEVDIWESLRESIRQELEQVNQQLKETNLMVEQSRIEVNKLAQRNAVVTTQLRQVHAQFESLPREDIHRAYEAALESQQRLFVMRGQLEKLQSDQLHLQRYAAALDQVQRSLEEAAGNLRPKGAASAETLELMIQAQESERLKLSRQMHDGPAQALSNFILQTEIAMRLFDVDRSKARQELESLKDTATSTFQKVRDFIFELRPMMLDDLGLIPTIKRYAAAFKEKTGVETSLVATGTEQRLASYLEVMLFRAVQEMLSTATGQGQATQLKIQVDMGEDSVRVAVEDNGRGLEPDALEKEGGMGLKVIKERVDMLGGNFRVDSVPGEGTRVSFQVPATRPEGLE